MAKLLDLEQQKKLKEFNYDEIIVVALCQTDYDAVEKTVIARSKPST